MVRIVVSLWKMEKNEKKSLVSQQMSQFQSILLLDEDFFSCDDTVAVVSSAIL